MATKKKRLLAYALAALLIVAALAAGLWGRNPAEPDGAAEEDDATAPLVGLSMADSTNPWTTEVVDHMAQAAKVHGMQLVYHSLEEKTSASQRQDALMMLEQGLDYLVLMPRSTDILPEIIAAAREREVPVVLICSDQSFRNACDGFISIDYALEGRLCARELAEKYGSAVCNIVEILGPEDSAIATQRESGFREELAKWPNLHIVQSVRSSFDRVIAEDEVTDLISRMPVGSFQAVFACSDEDGLGALNALKLAGYHPGKEISIVSINGIQDAIKALIAGEYTATIESGKSLGEQAILMVERLRNNYRKSRYWVVPYHVYDEHTDSWALNAVLY